MNQRRVRALPDYEVDGAKVPAFRKVFYADYLGRIMPAAYDCFANRSQACVFWWAMAREGVVAFLDCGQDGRLSNAGKTRDDEPRDLIASIDFAQAHYQEEGDPCDEFAMFSKACSVFDTQDRI